MTFWISSMTSIDHQKYAVQRAKLLFGSYRRSDATDPETYVLAISAVLACYDAELIRQVTDPTTGICTREKFRAFLPNAGELKAHCDDRAAHMAHVRELAALPRPDLRRLPAPPKGPPAPGSRANGRVPSEAPQYAAMCERAKTADPADWRWYDGGIMVAGYWLLESRPLPKGWKKTTHRSEAE
jgi:hypothetical protein